MDVEALIALNASLCKTIDFLALTFEKVDPAGRFCTSDRLTLSGIAESRCKMAEICIEHPLLLPFADAYTEASSFLMRARFGVPQGRAAFQRAIDVMTTATAAIEDPESEFSKYLDSL
jgi:hypothetical protein